MKLAVVGGEFGVARLAASEPVPLWAGQGSLTSVTRTADELSIVCAGSAIPEGVEAERGWACLRVVGRLDFSLTGVLASIADPLAAAGVSIFALSTFDTDYVLVRADSLHDAIECLQAAGHEVKEA